MTTPTRPRRWREVQRRPVPGNSPVRRFLRQAESIGPMGSQNKNQNHRPGGGVPPPVGRPRGPVKGRDGRGALCSSSAMSSDRLFLDRVARQHCPSPLHRHAQTNMHSLPARSKPDISTLQGIGHFYFALTTPRRCCSSSCSRVFPVNACIGYEVIRSAPGEGPRALGRSGPAAG